jgi:phenylacetate-CoA ligase
MMIVRGVNVFPTQIEELILKQASLAPHYQCILTREGPLDTLTVAVEVAAGVAHDSGDARSAADTLAHHIKSFIGTTARIELRPSGGIERSMGKARRVVDQRKL